MISRNAVLLFLGSIFQLALPVALQVALQAAVIPSSALGYIPHRQTIVGRMVRSHGKGAFIIEQDVLFHPTNGEPLIVHERWAVSSAESMRLTATATPAGKGSEQLRYDIVYRNGKRSVNEGGSVRSGSVGEDFIEGFFHARTTRGFYAEMISAHIADPDALRERPKIKKIEEVDHSPDEQLRLGREAGTVAWILGAPSPTDGPLNPEIWIDQDEFNLRKIRFPSAAEVTADRYSVYARTLHLPRERTVSWNGNSVLIRVSSVRAVTPAQIASTLEPASVANLGKTKIAKLPDVDQVKEFYARFR